MNISNGFNGLRRQAFIKGLYQGKVFRLKGDKPFISDKYHVFVVLNYNPKTSELLYLVNGTSQIKKSYDRLDAIDANPKETTVCMLAGEYRFISKDTIFDCNSIHTVRLSEIDFDSDALKSITCDQLSSEDIERLAKATLASPVVSPHIKSCIQAQS